MADHLSVRDIALSYPKHIVSHSFVSKWQDLGSEGLVGETHAIQIVVELPTSVAIVCIPKTCYL